jgi:hypothetical protein
MSEDFDNALESFTIRDVQITVEGITPYSPSRATRDKEKSESWDDYEAAVWRSKAHVDDTGMLYIPGTAFKLCLDEAAQNLNQKIPGKGNQTWTGVLRMGVAPLENMNLHTPLTEARCEKVFCHSNGKRGPGTRVMRWFPILHKWGGTITMRIFNDNLTQAKFEEFFIKAGLLAGVGRGRPSSGCPIGNGRFRPVKFVWSEVA